MQTLRLGETNLASHRNDKSFDRGQKIGLR